VVAAVKQGRSVRAMFKCRKTSYQRIYLRKRLSEVFLDVCTEKSLGFVEDFEITADFSKLCSFILILPVHFC
jgi:hypothetical protein